MVAFTLFLCEGRFVFAVLHALNGFSRVVCSTAVHALDSRSNIVYGVHMACVQMQHHRCCFLRCAQTLETLLYVPLGCCKLPSCGYCENSTVSAEVHRRRCVTYRSVVADVYCCCFSDEIQFSPSVAASKLAVCSFIPLFCEDVQ